MPLATAVGQTGALNWLHTHHHGAPILTTNAAGTVVPYPAHAVLGFPGQFANSQQLAGAQHYYNRYRDYDVNTGRYIQADPIGLAGDDNPYAYAGGNPLRYVDPSGDFYAQAGGFVIGFGSDIAGQAFGNWLQGRDVFDHRCYDFKQALISGVLGALGTGPGILASKITTVKRITRSGEIGIRQTYPSGRVFDITAKRVKEYLPNTHPNARPGSLQPEKFPNAIPGTKGLKRAPTPYEQRLLDKWK